MTRRENECEDEGEEGVERETSGRDEVTSGEPDADGSANPDAPEHPEEREEYADWSLPGQPASGQGDEPAGSTDEAPGRTDDDPPVPPEVREPLLGDRFRERLGVTQRQWFVVESFLLVLPYPFFVLVYLTVDVNETAFLVVTLAYSLVAMYVGFLS